MAETWVLNEQLDPVLQLPKKTISFTSNGQAYAAISFQNRELVYYTNPYSSSGTTAYEYTPWGAQEHWTNSAYRTITFDSTPTGSLLSWLQKNGTKQSEPEPDVKKNVCLIDGIGYSIKQGKVLIDGTAYTVKKGRTLIDETGYDIAIAEDPIMITVVGGDTKTGSRARAYVIYNDQKYTDTTFEVQPGETVQVYLNAYASATTADKRKQQVTLNGVVVASFGSGPDNRKVIYDYTPTKSATITITMYSNRPGGTPLYSTAAIVES